jgi:hypothetical protein
MLDKSKLLQEKNKSLQSRIDSVESNIAASQNAKVALKDELKQKKFEILTERERFDNL